VQRQRPDPQAGSCLHGAANRFHAREVTRAARQAASGCPTPASVHNDGRVNSVPGVAARIGGSVRRDK
jgi:hypothetical protein